MTLLEIISKCQNKDREAQALLYKKYKRVLFVLCLKYCKNKEDAQDVLQDSFITIFTKINNYKHSGSFEGWMKRITIHKAIDKYHTENNTNLVSIIEGYHEDVEFEDNLEGFSLNFILSLVQQLPNQYRLVFSLYALDNYSHKEIARLLDISIGTSKSNLHRAKKILQKKIEASKSTHKYG